MRSKTLLKQKLLIPAFVVVVIYLLFSFFGNYKKTAQIDSTPSAENTVTSDEQKKMPLRLKIPEINIDVPLRPVGLDSTGAMETPEGPDDVVWFEPGSYPGEEGNFIIAGHYGTWKNGKGSVFDNLHKLTKGNKLFIEDEKGSIIAFAVRESRSYKPDADASDVFNSDDGKSHLNLITCGGTWNKDLKSYSQRLVIFADKE